MQRKIAVILISIFVFTSCAKKHYMQELINKGAFDYTKATYPKEAKEATTPVELKVTGKVPLWLKGKLFQNTPGKFSVGGHNLTHPFDGFAFISSFELRKGKVYYSGAFVKSDQFVESMKENRLRILGFGQNFGDPKAGHVSRDGQKVKTTNPNINIEKVGYHLIALGETPLPVEFSPDTMETLGIFDYDDTLKKAKMWESAHMKRDPDDGALYNFHIDYGMSSYYVLYKISEGKTSRELIAKHRASEPSYMHDFSITKNYIILTAYPLVVSSMDLMNIFSPNAKYSFIGAHRWEPERGTIVYVFDKKDGHLVSKIKAEPKFAFHHINAFEDKEGMINLYLTTFGNAEIALLVGDPANKPGDGQLQKMVIDVKNNSINLSSLSDNLYEMPKIKETLLGRENRYFYAVWYNADPNRNGLGLAQYDMKTNKAKSWYRRGLFPGEPMFISNSAAKKEDDGVILSVVYDKPKKRSFLLIIDAGSMRELGRAFLPEALPLGLHGKFI